MYRVYRTQLWYEQMKDKKLTIPLCIPSMSRPTAYVFQHLDGFHRDEVFIFIRPTVEQRNLYQQYNEKFTLVELPDWVKDIGTTREAMVQWAYQNGYQRIFMLDGRITAVNYLVPRESKSGNVSLSAPRQSMRDGLLVWERILQDFPFTLSCPAHKGFSYYPENINAPYQVNNGNIAAAICVDVQDLVKHNIHYRPIDTCGWEDMCIMLDVMKAGLPTCKITDLEYDEVPSDKILTGGNRVDGKNQVQLAESKNKLLWEQYLGIPYPSRHQYIYLRKTRGVPYAYTRWKYWKEFYAAHSVKNINT